MGSLGVNLERKAKDLLPTHRPIDEASTETFVRLLGSVGCMLQ